MLEDYIMDINKDFNHNEIMNCPEDENDLFHGEIIIDEEPVDRRELNPLNHRKPNGTTDQGHRQD